MRQMNYNGSHLCGIARIPKLLCHCCPNLLRHSLHQSNLDRRKSSVDKRLRSFRVLVNQSYRTYTVHMIDFEWDSAKAESNVMKHGVTFGEARSVFFDEFALQFYDDKNSQLEDRFLMLGMSNESRLLLVCHCERRDGQVIRIISARKATSTERKHYQGG